jgi:hypothetical protein
MILRQQVSEASYEPDALQILGQAYDEAWDYIASNFDSPQAIETAREKLARIMLDFPHGEIRDVEYLKLSSLQIMSLFYKSRVRSPSVR